LGDGTVISLKKYLDMKLERWAPGEPATNQLLDVAVQSYRTALLDMGKTGYQVCPANGAALQQSLAHLEQQLAEEVSAELLQAASQIAGEQLSLWGERTAEHLKGKAQEVKDLLMALARTAESLGERDQRYSARLLQFTSHLRSVADLEDLTQVRTSLMRTAGELKTCIEQMDQDSQQVIAQLESKVSAYESRLKETEDLALRDVLTGLANRLYIERRLKFRIESQQPFCLAFLDLDHFKAVNDRYGHSVGDLLLKQFADELRGNLRPVDLVGRWGGDEFVLLLDADLTEANTVLDRVRKWVFGSYTIPGDENGKKIRLIISAATGLAEWLPGEPMQQLIQRADRAMYKEKKLHRVPVRREDNSGRLLVRS
jgi:diguanylate cyclase (GGDEF)-like protein